MPATSVTELIALLKGRPGGFNYASTGSGSSGHLAAELFKTMAGVDMVHVPYRGAAPVLSDILAGRVQVYFANPASVIGPLQEGKLRALAVASPKRVSDLPDVPTLAEQGVEGIEGSGWIGFVAPAGIPENVKQKLTDALIGAIQHPDVQARLKAQFMEPVGNSPEEFANYMDEELQRWAPLIKRLNLSVN